ncbi:LPXTG cell wall anchor domain-containing protein [Lacticaseibacillus suihuaensis]
MHKCFWPALIALLLALGLAPKAPVLASQATINIGAANQRVSVYDVTHEFWSHQPRNANQQAYWQSRLAAAGPHQAPLLTGLTRADGTARFTLDARRAGCQAVYLITTSGGIQNIVGLMPQDGTPLDAWPKALLTQPTPPQETPPRPTPPPGPNLPQTGEITRRLLSVLGVAMITLLLRVSRRRCTTDPLSRLQ